MIRKSLLIGALALVLFALAGAATSQATPPLGGWFEGTGVDAGDVPKTAQVPLGAGAHTLIIGNLTDVNDADMYQVCLTGGRTFSATTNPAATGALSDPQLSLFNANGFGVYGNDDKVANNQSTLPAGDPLTPSAPGVYYLAISSYDNDAVSAGGEIFDDGASDPGPSGPTGPGGLSPISGWDDNGNYTGRYEIVLTGAIFCGPASIEKDPELQNLWLCNAPGFACTDTVTNINGAWFDVELTNTIKSRDPKCTGFPNFEPDPRQCPFETIGSFEFEVRYDAKFVDVDIFRGDLWAAAGGSVGVQCDSIEGEGFEQFRCNTIGKPGAAEPGINGPGTLARVRVTPTADVYSILVANQLNGIATQLINQDCQLSDTQGHPIPVDVCDNAAVTIRYLEGDVHADCRIDVQDQQQIAFRWGSRLGQLLYNSRYDLEPSYPKKGDSDIDAKDLQLVYGRYQSTCADPHPAQDPVDPKSKEGEPPIS